MDFIEKFYIGVGYLQKSLFIVSLVLTPEQEEAIIRNYYNKVKELQNHVKSYFDFMVANARPENNENTENTNNNGDVNENINDNRTDYIINHTMPYKERLI